jgi:hypothetical protein
MTALELLHSALSVPLRTACDSSLVSLLLTCTHQFCSPPLRGGWTPEPVCTGWKCKYSWPHRDSNRSRNSVVGIATSYRLDDRGIRVPSPGRVKNFLFSKSSRPALRSTQPPIPWVPGALSPGVAPGASSWPLTSDECRGQENVDLYIHSPYAFMA